MRKWMRDRLKRKKTPEAGKGEPTPAPLQPAYFDAGCKGAGVGSLLPASDFSCALVDRASTCACLAFNTTEHLRLMEAAAKRTKTASRMDHVRYNKLMPIPPELRGRKYISLTTCARTGPPLWTR